MRGAPSARIVASTIRPARTLQTTPASLVGEAAPLASRAARGAGSSVLGDGAVIAHMRHIVAGDSEDLMFPDITFCAIDAVRIANRALLASRARRGSGQDAGDAVEAARLARRGAGRTRKLPETARVALRQLRRDVFTIPTSWTRLADVVDVTVGTCGRGEGRKRKRGREREGERERKREERERRKTQRERERGESE